MADEPTRKITILQPTLNDEPTRTIILEPIRKDNEVTYERSNLAEQAIKGTVNDALRFVKKHAWLRTALGVRGSDELFTALDRFIENNHT